MMSNNKTKLVGKRFRKKTKFSPGDNAVVMRRYVEYIRHGLKQSETSIRLQIEAINDFETFVFGQGFSEHNARTDSGIQRQSVCPRFR